MRISRVRDSKMKGTVAGLWAAGMLFISTPLLGQGTTASPAAPEQTSDANVAPPTIPIPSSLSLVDAPPGKSPEPFASRDKVLEALLRENFSYNQYKMVDPFVSFIVPVEAPRAPTPDDTEEFEPPPEPQRPLTPLQKMNLGEIEGGLKAIAWGELGRRALIEDSAGKGYIVAVGTPAGERDGVVTDIFNDHIVIQQQFWDRKAKRMVPQDFTVKLKKQQQAK
jgi:Tfp pilus assembly protein PilP